MAPLARPIERVLSRLQGVRRCGKGWEARCPAHEDRTPSLSVHEGIDGRVLLCCHAGCEFTAVVAALGLKPRDLFNGEPVKIGQSSRSSSWRIRATYDYRDVDGQLRFQVCRLQPTPQEPKPFRQRRRHDGRWVWGLRKGDYKLRAHGAYTRLHGKKESREGAVELPAVERILYRLPEVMGAIESGEWILVCEGEKDADNAADLGLATTTFAGGAGKWHVSCSRLLQGARVALVPDNDPAGRKGAAKIAASLKAEGVHVHLIDLGGTAKGYDLSDWIEEQRLKDRACEEIRDELLARIEASAKWTAQHCDDRPRIVLSTRQREVVDQGLSALARSPEIYRRSGCLVQVVRDEIQGPGILRSPASPAIQPAAPPRVRELMSDSAAWQTEDGQSTHPPKWAVEALMARGTWPQLRPLEGIIETPVLRPDGSILERPGYDPDTGLLYEPNTAFRRVPEAPMCLEVEQALETLLEAVCDFPFATDAHRSAWLSSVLTSLGRFAFRGPSPLNLYDANVRAAGKSLLADVTGMIVLGRSMARMAPTHNDSEERKRITAIALAGDPLVLIDNVTGPLGSPALDAALTGTQWSDRLLGQSVQLNLPLRVVWFATGNNLQLCGDTSRRSLHVRLDSPEEFPERRGGFRHPQLLEWVRRNRARLVVAGLTILRAFVQAGRPDQSLTPWGSFDGWSALIRQALVWAGQADPGETRNALQVDADRDRETLERLLSGWAEAVSQAGEALSVSQALKLLEDRPEDLVVLRAAVADLCSTPVGLLPKPRALGNRLKKYCGRVIQGRALLQAGKSKLGMKWTVDSVANGDSGDSGDSAHRPKTAAESPEKGRQEPLRLDLGDSTDYRVFHPRHER